MLKSTEIAFTIWREGETFLNLDLQIPAKEEWEEVQQSYHSTDLYTVIDQQKRKVVRLEGNASNKKKMNLPSESLTGRWCCRRPAGRTRFVPARHARPKGRPQSLLHILPLTLNPWSQCLRFQGRVTPT